MAPIELHASADALIKDVKDLICQKTEIHPQRQKLFSFGTELKNTRTLQESGLGPCHSNHYDTSPAVITMQVSDTIPLERAPSVMLATAAANVAAASRDTTLTIPPTFHPPSAFMTKIVEARHGLAAGLAPRLAMEGTGGTYFLRNPHKENVAVFKPGDEEPFTPNNPRGYNGVLGQPGLKPGILSGEGHLREVAAFLLDHSHFHRVPITTLAEMSHASFFRQSRVIQAMPTPILFSSHAPGFTSPKLAQATKVGSLQEFIDYDEVAGDLAPQKFPVADVHRIGILDIRIVNTDRNDANILVKRSGRSGAISLIPIDHAYCLPDTLEIAWSDWVWMEWPQAKQPFEEATKTFVKNININADIELLRSSLGIREPCLRLMRVTTMLLQKGVGAGLNLYEIASIMVRDDVDKPSELEDLCQRASDMARSVRSNVRKVSPSRSGANHRTPPHAVARIDEDAVDDHESPAYHATTVSPGLHGRAPHFSPPAGLHLTPAASLASRSNRSSTSSTPALPTANVPALHTVTLHRSVSHVNFRQAENSSGTAKGFLADSMESKRQRWKNSARRGVHVDPLASGGGRHHSMDGQPDSPDFTFETTDFSRPDDEIDLGEVFFTYLEPLIDQTVLRVAHKRVSPAHATASHSQTDSTKNRALNLSPVSTSSSHLGFDFVEFTDSLESPALLPSNAPEVRVASLSLHCHSSGLAKPIPPTSTNRSLGLKASESRESLNASPTKAPSPKAPVQSSALGILKGTNAHISVPAVTKSANSSPASAGLAPPSKPLSGQLNSQSPATAPIAPSPSAKKYIPPHMRAAMAAAAASGSTSTTSSSPSTSMLTSSTSGGNISTPPLSLAPSPLPLPSSLSPSPSSLHSASPDAGATRTLSDRALAKQPHPHDTPSIFRSLSPLHETGTAESLARGLAFAELPRPLSLSKDEKSPPGSSSILAHMYESNTSKRSSLTASHQSPSGHARVAPVAPGDPLPPTSATRPFAAPSKQLAQPRVEV